MVNTETEAARAAERERIADLIDADADLIAGFASDKRAAVELVALLVRHAGAEREVAPSEDRLEVG